MRSAQLADAKGRLLRAQEICDRAGRGKSDESARVAGDLGKAEGECDRLQKNHDALQRLIAKQAATRNELTVNDLSLSRRNRK